MSESRGGTDGVVSEGRRWESIVDRFNQAWQQGLRPAIRGCLPESGPERTVVLIELVHAELKHRLTAGEAARVEEYLQQYPELGSDHQVVLDLIEAEHALRRRREPGLTPEEYCGRFPQYRAELAARLPPPLPQPATGPDDGHGQTPPDGEESPTVAKKAPISAGKPNLHAPVIPDYQVLGLLSDEGGMGELWRVNDPKFHRILAVKVLRKEYRGQYHRFLREARITGQLQHPGIPPVHDLGTLADGRPFIAMKLIRGCTLRDLLREHPAPAHDLVRRIFGRVCQAVAFAHSCGFVHRDLKPGNVMVGEFGEVQVMDWGLAKALDRERSNDAALPTEEVNDLRIEPADAAEQASRAGEVMGTPSYMAPEQARGEVEQLDERCDVFSLGAILCEMLTSEPPYPFLGRKFEEIHLQAAQGDLAAAFAQLDGCGADGELVDLVKSCLSRERENRPRDAGVVGEKVAAYQTYVQDRLRQVELERAAAQAKAEEEQRTREMAEKAQKAEQARAEKEREAREAAEAKAASERGRRKLTMALAGTGILVLCLIGGGGWWYQQNQASRAAEQATRRIITEHDGNAAVRKVLDRIEEGYKHAENLERWQAELQASSAALEQAEAALNRGEPTEELRNRVGSARDELKKAQADRRSAVQIERIIAQMFESRAALFLQYGETASQIAQVFQERGMDVLNTETVQLVEWVKGHPRCEQLLGILETWAAWTPQPKTRERIVEVIRGVDPKPDTIRIRWREALFRKDKTALVTMADHAMVSTLPPAALVLMCLGLMAVDADEKAIGVLKDSHVRFPGDYLINLHLGLALLNGKPPRAEESLPYLTAAVALRHESALSHLELGNALEKKGDLEGAIRCFRRAVQLEDKYALAYNNWGVALKRKGEIDEAIKCFHLALERDPKLVLAHSNLSNAMVQKRNPKEAILSAENALRIDPRNVNALINLGVAHHANREPAEAIKRWHEALEIDPTNPHALTNLGVASSENGDYETAIQYYHRAINSDDSYAMAHCNLGLALLKQKLFHAALRALELGHDLGSKQPDWRYPSSEWVRKARHLVTLDEKLPAILFGEARPMNVAELMEFASFATHQKQLYAAIANLLLETFKTQPTWVDDQKAAPRYYAACCAVMASSGQGAGADCLTAEDRTRWRLQALVWLQEELVVVAKQLENSNPEERNSINRKLQYWRMDGWLSAVRDGQVGQTEAEQENWRKFWADVNALLKKTREAK